MSYLEEIFKRAETYLNTSNILDYDGFIDELEKQDKIKSNVLDKLSEDRKVDWFQEDRPQELIEENISIQIRITDTIKEIERIKIPEKLTSKIESRLKKKIGSRRSYIVRTISLKEDLFTNPDLIRIQGRRTWSSVQKWFRLTDKELERFKSENPEIDLK